MKSKKILLVLVVIVFALVLGYLNTESSSPFTPEEIAWMMEHPVIYVAPDPTYGPIEFFDQDDNFDGVASDYLKWIGDHSPLTFEVIQYDTWPEALDAVGNGDVDMLSAAIWTEQRDTYLEFSNNYFTVPNVVVARNGLHGKLDLEDLRGKQVIVIEDYATDEYISLNYPDIDLIRVSSTVEGLSLVSIGTYDYMVVSLAQASYYLPESKITNIKVYGQIDFDNQVAFGVKDDYKDLVPILNKILDQMPDDVHDEIYVKWVNLDYSTGISEEIIRYIIVAVALALVSIAVILFFNHLLHVKVKVKTQELNEELDLRIEAEKQVVELNEHLEEMVEQRTQELSRTLVNLKSVQKDLVESEKMASLSRILINISHNLNTPIGSAITINSYEDLVLRQLKEEDQDCQQSIKKLINTNNMVKVELDKAKTFLDAMKRMTSIDAGSNKEKVDICKYLKSLLMRYASEFHDKEVTCNVTCDIEPEYRVSNEYLDNIFVNLINNSLQFGFDKQKMGIISIEIIKFSNHLEIVYEDNGGGIDESIIENIFDPLFTSNMGKTSGWGLSILYNTVKFALGGEVTLTSSKGHGVKFNIIIRH